MHDEDVMEDRDGGDVSSCGDEEGGADCGQDGKKEDQAAANKGRAKGKSDTKPPANQPAAPAPAAVKHVYPFNIRYAAEILDLTGFVDGQEYSDGQIKDLLIQNGYTEFADVEPAFHLSAATNTLVITIKGSKKGADHG